jgi:hypothetical protein
MVELARRQGRGPTLQEEQAVLEWEVKTRVSSQEIMLKLREGQAHACVPHGEHVHQGLCGR